MPEIDPQMQRGGSALSAIFMVMAAGRPLTPSGEFSLAILSNSQVPYPVLQSASDRRCEPIHGHAGHIGGRSVDGASGLRVESGRYLA